jgi:hypothetical protein
MKSKLILLALVTLLGIWSLVNLTASNDISSILNVAFEMDSKFEVYPGQTLTIPGKIYNTGYLNLYDLTLHTENVPAGFSVDIEPNYFKPFVRKFIWKDTPRGIPAPTEFNVTIKVPADAKELTYEFNITAKGDFKIFIPSEQTYKTIASVSKNQRIVLKTVPAPHFSVTDITLPEQVVENEPFNITMIVINDGYVTETANISVTVPEGWTVVEKTKSVRLSPGENSSVMFEITPTNTSGNISVLMSYPFNQTIITVSKAGPFLIPVPAPEITPPEVAPTGLAALIDFIQSLPTWVIIVIVVLVLIIVWNLWKIFVSERKKPEEVKETKKKQVEQKTTTEISKVDATDLGIDML